MSKKKRKQRQKEEEKRVNHRIITMIVCYNLPTAAPARRGGRRVTRNQKKDFATPTAHPWE
jgi:hypothetical protein